MGNSNKERTTYQSQPAEYKLDANRLFNVVSDLIEYANAQKQVHENANSGHSNPTTQFIGVGLKFILNTGVVNEEGYLTGFDLATLVLSEDAKELTFKIHGNAKVAIDPIKLNYIADQYKLKD